MYRALLSFFLIFTFLLTACEKRGDGASQGEAGTRGLPSSPVLAKVDGQEILTLDDFNKTMALLPEPTRKRMSTKEDTLKQLEKIIDEALLLREAEKRGLDQDPEVLGKIDRYRTRLVTEKLYKQVAEEQAEVTEEDILKYYEDNRDRFAKKGRIQASHILIVVPQNASPEKAAESKTKAEEALKKAKAGEDFAELAKEYSEGPTAARGGDLGYFSKGRMVPEFEQAAFSMQEIGDISDIVKSKFGYHIIKLTGREEPKQLALDEVRDRIIRQLESQSRRDVRKTLATTLRENATIEVFEELLPGEPAQPAGEAPPAPPMPPLEP